MSYDKGLQIDYNLGLVDFGNGNTTYDITGPTGKRGRVKAVSLICTETFNAVTTPAHVLVGTAADTDAYVDYTVGELAAGAGVVKTDESGLTIVADLPADTEARISCIAPTGGTPAGIAYTTVTIVWY